MGLHWQGSRSVVFRSWSWLDLCCVPFTDHTAGPALLYVSQSSKSYLQILNFHFHAKQMLQPGNVQSPWSTAGTLDSVWHGRDFMTQATYEAKYLLFSTYTSIQFGLMTRITADYEQILHYLGTGAIWLYNKIHSFQANLGRCQIFIINMETNT